MPKRNREQQDKHNETRRKFIKNGKKAIFCIDHLKVTHPSLVKEVFKIYDYLHELYPNKRNLAKTEIYLKEIKNKKINRVEPVLTIPLLQKNQPTSHTSSTETARVEEIPPVLPVLTDEETNTLIRELQDDPDLKYFFHDDLMMTNEVVVKSCGATGLDVFMSTEKPSEGIEPKTVQPKTVEEEINRLIREEFETLGADLPDLICEDDELTR